MRRAPSRRRCCLRRPYRRTGRRIGGGSPRRAGRRTLPGASGRFPPGGMMHDLYSLTWKAFRWGENKKRTDACPFSCPSFVCASRSNPWRVAGADDLSGFAPVSVSSVCFRSRPNAELHGCSCRCDYSSTWIISPGAWAGKGRSHANASGSSVSRRA